MMASSSVDELLKETTAQFLHQNGLRITQAMRKKNHTRLQSQWTRNQLIQ